MFRFLLYRFFFFYNYFTAYNIVANFICFSIGSSTFNATACHPHRKGFAMVVTLAVPAREMFGLKDIITLRHLDNMNKIILVVEDQPEIRKLICMTMDYDGFEVHEAENGDSGLRMVKALRPVALRYLTNGLGWSADYVALYNEKGGSIDMQGWVTLTNQTGTTFHMADTVLVAGAPATGGAELPGGGNDGVSHGGRSGTWRGSRGTARRTTST